MKTFNKTLVWFRRDLRNFDHAALHYALEQSRKVFCVFVFDTAILEPLRLSGIQADRRIDFIHASVSELDDELRRQGSALIALLADAKGAIPELAARLGVDAVFANHDYEPQAVARDLSVARALERDGRRLLTFKDQVIFEKDEVLSLAGRPFSVFTPYKNAWLKRLGAAEHGAFSADLAPLVTESRFDRLAPASELPIAGSIPSPDSMGFSRSVPEEPGLMPGMTGGQALLDDFMERIDRYAELRDFPAIKGPSYLSVHLRFGTVSIRGLVRRALDALHQDKAGRLDGASAKGAGAAIWLSELVWRDFYFMILHHHPRVAGGAFKPEYDAIAWESGPQADDLFRSWCLGETGYPLIDAAMAQLNRTGYMHNRLRMVTASFLIKDLGIDWRRGEAYFAEKLNDFDLSANNGGWQWAASSGCDAQPYFRIFNPITQSEKFDPQGMFIRRYLPRLASLNGKEIHAPWMLSEARLANAGIRIGRDYPVPIVRHDEARQRTLLRYEVVRKIKA